MSKAFPFVFGAQYYRAPTPEPECWGTDLPGMKALGFNSVKYFVQWRWSHRRNDRFVFDDLDQLMDLAYVNGLRVTLNVLFDVSPHWLFDKYRDAKQVMNNGREIEPYAVGHRQIGGHPGPCYNHPGALEERKKFLAATVEHFLSHPALAMWDIWNEPELSYSQRTPNAETLVCYCPHCRRQFLAWLKGKYGALQRLNQVWGRCYEDWEDVELPRSPSTITDFVDWREFHIATMTREAAWRLEMVAQKDPDRVHYLHVVPNVISLFNSVTCCADDFELAQLCDVFAATMNGGPLLASQVLSAARGKVCYNVESHINHGCTTTHQAILSLPDLLRDFLPQIGLGIRGFLFWQYRSEVLGSESPAWGVVKLDGTDRPITRAVRTFWQTLSPHVETLLRCHPPSAEIGIWKSRKNEIFHFCVHEELLPLADGVNEYVQALYWQNLPYRFISGEMLERGELDGLKMLIMPSPYYLAEQEARSLNDWVQKGGVLLTEAHLGGYDGTLGRHSRTLPGCGLAEAWGIRETDSTSPCHLKLDADETSDGSVTEDVRKALADSKASGGQYFPIRLVSGHLAWGASRYATLQGDRAAVEGSWEPAAPCLISQKVGNGFVFYCGTNLGQGAKKDPAGLVELLHKTAEYANVCSTLNVQTSVSGQIHVDAMEDEAGLRFLMILSRSGQAQSIQMDGKGHGYGLFSEMTWSLSRSEPLTVPGNFVDLVVVG